MGFGIITQHLSFYKKHKFIQFENNQTGECFSQLRKGLAKAGGSTLLNANTPLFTGAVKGWITDLAKMGVFLSCEKRLRLGGLITLPYKGLSQESTTLTINRLAPYSHVALGAVIPLYDADSEPEPMSIEDNRLDFEPFSHHDLFFIDPEKPFARPDRPVLILLLLEERVMYTKPKISPPALPLFDESFDYGDKLASTTHPLINV